MTAGQNQVQVDTSGNTLNDALDGLFAAHPGIRDRLLTEQREIRPHINVFVKDREVRTMGGLATPLVNGVEISIIPAISGGSPRGSETSKVLDAGREQRPFDTALGPWSSPSQIAPSLYRASP
jgi:molybdopterin converting factor small subunit